MRVPSVEEFWQGMGRRRRSLLVILALAYLASGVYYVPADRQAVQIRLGRMLEGRAQPGLHYALPYPVDRVILLRINEAQRLSIGGTDLSRALGVARVGEADYLLTGDQNLVRTRASIQYYIEAPHPYLFRTEDLTSSLRALLLRALSRAVAERHVDEILTTGRVALQNEVQRDLQAEADRLELGVTLTTMTLEQVTPPEEVRDAFLEVANAREDRNRIVQEAGGYASELLPRARGEAREISQQAEIHRTEVVNRAQGESQHFVSLWQEYRVHPEVTTARLFLEAMEEILPRTKKVILDDSGSGQGVDLDILEGLTFPTPTRAAP